MNAEQIGQVVSRDEMASLRVVAVVSTSDGRELLVLNRPVRFKYERLGQDFLGSDGPLRDLLYYERGGGRLRAFAGRELTLDMVDGTIEKVKDHWWHGILKDSVSVAYGDIDSLRACYVFSGGACMSPEDYAALRATYTGVIYPYWDYEKVIKYDSLRKELWGKIFHLEGRVNALIGEVKKKDAALSRPAPTEAEVEAAAKRMWEADTGEKASEFMLPRTLLESYIRMARAALVVE